MGRKPKYNEPTVTKSFRIPVSKVEIVTGIINDFLNGDIAQYPVLASGELSVKENNTVEIIHTKNNPAYKLHFPCGCVMGGKLFKRDKSCKLT